MAEPDPVKAHYDAIGALYDAENDGDQQDLPFWSAMASRTGGPILELACGSGRVLAALADPQWAPVVGLDLSKSFLERACARMAAHAAGKPMLEAGQLKLVEGDMRAFDLPMGEGYALVVIALNSFLHLTDPKDQLACLKEVARHLKPGGLLAMEVFNPENKDKHPGVHGLELVADFSHPETGERVQRFAGVSTDLATQRRRYVNLYDTLAADGTVRRTVREFMLRYVYRHELERMLEQAGLALEAVYGGYEFEPYTGREDLLLVVANKPE
ncbi:MAG TPA: class I SAM-dependent methyltransferase [Myxococcales bacterium]|jgi:SAM-dependent methyltransferase